MFFAIAAVLVVAQATSAPAPSADTKPLRTVVYKVSYSRAVNTTVEHYGGGANDPYDSTMASDTDDGTVTVDIMQVAAKTLAMRITELWNKSGRPVTVLGNVAPDGSPNFGPNSITDVTRELLPMFGPLFAADQAMDTVGTEWIINFDGKDVHVNTKYRVKKIDGDTVTLEKAQTIKISGVDANTVDVSGTIGYKPALLVPVSGDITKRASQSSASASAQIIYSLHFRRVSDTREPAAK